MNDRHIVCRHMNRLRRLQKWQKDLPPQHQPSPRDLAKLRRLNAISTYYCLSVETSTEG